MKPNRWITVTVHVYCLLTNQLVKAVYWNWFLTNPHDVETDVAETTVLRDEPPIAAANVEPSPGGTILDRFRTHPKNQRRKTNETNVDNQEGVRLEDSVINDYDQSSGCSADRDCQIGTFCDRHYGICKPYKGDGQPCRSGAHCAIGLDCLFGRCLASAKPGHKGARCNSDRDCLPSMCCARQHGEHVCKPKLKLGQNCFVPDGGLAYWLNEICPCDTGLVCGYVTTLGQSASDWINLWTDQNRLRCIQP